MRYLAKRGNTERKNLFKVTPNTMKKDETLITQVEADQLNTTIPSDYFDLTYFNRMTKAQMLMYFGGCTLGAMTIMVGAKVH